MLADHPDGSVIDVWVVPGSSRTEIVGEHDGALRVRVSAPPEKGAANEAVARLLAETFSCSVELRVGAGSRRKRFLLRGVTQDDAQRVIAGLT